MVVTKNSMPTIPYRTCPVFIWFLSPVERGALRIEGPVRDQVLHGHGVVARAQALREVELMRLFNLELVEVDAEPRPLRHLDGPALDAERLPGQALPVLPDP